MLFGYPSRKKIELDVNDILILLEIRIFCDFANTDFKKRSEKGFWGG